MFKNESEAPELSRTERKKARARAELIDAALSLFEEQGYEATSIAQITAKADYAVGTFYNHFDGKAELVRAAVMDRLTVARGELGAAGAGAGSAPEKLRAIILSAGRVMSEDRALFALYFKTHRSLEAAVVDAHAPAMAAMLDGIIAQGQAAGEVRNDMPPHIVGELLQAALQSSVLSSIDLPLVDNLTVKVDLILTGLRPA